MKKYWAGLFHGLGVGLVMAWYANSQYGFGGSDSILVFPLAIVLVVTGTALRMQANKFTEPSAAEYRPRR